VSDIGMDGMFGLLAALATIVLGLLGAVLAGLVALVATLPPGDRTSDRVGRFVAGPLACAGMGGTLLLLSESGGKLFDDFALAFPLIGIGIWIGIAIALHRRWRASVEQWRS
jgi:hypothetical protein